MHHKLDKLSDLLLPLRQSNSNLKLPLTHTLVLVMFVVNSLVHSKVETLLLVPKSTVVRASKVLIRAVLIWSVVVPSLMLITPLMG
jgi:hypothetical protein